MWPFRHPLDFLGSDVVGGLARPRHHVGAALRQGSRLAIASAATAFPHGGDRAV